MTAETERIIEQQQLENGIELLLYDRSRITAGDRWQVQLLCEAHIAIDKSYWDMVSQEESRLLPDIRKILGARLVFVTTKERNFVEAEERETVLQEMVQQVHNSMLEYMKKPQFPQEFFKKQYRETLQKVLLQQSIARANDKC
jgi:hypothetical protein